MKALPIYLSIYLSDAAFQHAAFYPLEGGAERETRGWVHGCKLPSWHPLTCTRCHGYVHVQTADLLTVGSTMQTCYIIACMQEYLASMRGVAETLLQALALAAGLTQEAFIQDHTQLPYNAPAQLSLHAQVSQQQALQGMEAGSSISRPVSLAHEHAQSAVIGTSISRASTSSSSNDDGDSSIVSSGTGGTQPEEPPYMTVKVCCFAVITPPVLRGGRHPRVHVAQELCLHSIYFLIWSSFAVQSKHRYWLLPTSRLSVYAGAGCTLPSHCRRSD